MSKSHGSSFRLITKVVQMVAAPLLWNVLHRNGLVQPKGYAYKDAVVLAMGFAMKRRPERLMTPTGRRLLRVGT